MKIKVENVDNSIGHAILELIGEIENAMFWAERHEIIRIIDKAAADIDEVAMDKREAKES